MISSLLFLIALESAELKSIVLLGSDCKDYRITAPSSCVVTEGFIFPKLTEQLEANIAWGSEIDRELVLDIRKEIIRTYKRFGRPIVIVEIPPQSLSNGIIHYQVIEGLLGEVQVKGNCWFADRLFQRAIHLTPGCPIDEYKLLNDVALLNRSPFHRTDVVYTPGECQGYTNIELINRDRFPLRVYAGGDNTGTRQIDRVRLFTGFDCGYAFGLDQTFSYQYTASPNFSEFQSHTFHYFGVLPWNHVFLFFGGLAFVKPPNGSFVRSDGKSGQASVRYEIPIPSLYEGWLHEIHLGFDGKSTNNNLVFLGSGEPAILKNTANLSQFVLGYDIGWKNRTNIFSLSVLCFYSPGRMLPNEEDADLAVFRTGAKNQYLYGKAALSYQYIYTNFFSLWFEGRFQKSSRPLLASEQISIGGYDTVRGFDERLYNGDNGVIGNFEIQTLEYPIIGIFKPRCPDKVMGYWFFDCGFAELMEDVLGEPRRAFLSSTGPGMKYRIGEWFSARAAWGFKLHNVKSLGDTSLGKLHAGLILSF